MKHLFKTILFFLSVLLFTTSSTIISYANNSNINTIIDSTNPDNKYAASVVQLYVNHLSGNSCSYLSFGTAFFINDKQLVTANHVIESNKKNLTKSAISIAFRYYTEFGAIKTDNIKCHIVTIDKEHDMAIIEVDKPEQVSNIDIVPLELDTAPVTTNGKYECVNFYLDDKELALVNSLDYIGMYQSINAKASLNRKYHFSNMMGFTGITSKGSSGGPILRDGKVIGIAQAATFTEGELIATLYGTKAEYIEKLIGSVTESSDEVYAANF